MKTALIVALCTLASSAHAQFGAGSSPQIYPAGYSHMYGKNAGTIVTIGVGALAGEDYFVPSGMDSPFDTPFVPASDPYLVFPLYDPNDTTLVDVMNEISIQKEHRWSLLSNALAQCIEGASANGPPSKGDVADCVDLYGSSLEAIVNPANDMNLLPNPGCPDLVLNAIEDLHDETIDRDDDIGIPGAGCNCNWHVFPTGNCPGAGPTLLANMNTAPIDLTGLDQAYRDAFWHLEAQLKGLQHRYYEEVSDPVIPWQEAETNWEFGYLVAWTEFVDAMDAATPGS